ncbi:MAG: FAD:protein FMN transferase [Actinomycetia bacterium]|nr:FAD:protein FMN transferase [Actinomycetes bacterium]
MTVATFDAMGTSVDVHIKDHSDVDVAKAMFDRYEGLFSRFDPDSELSRINRANTSLTVSVDMRALLGAAKELRVATDGLTDIGIGAAVRGWGYTTTFDEVVDSDAVPLPVWPGAWSMDGDRVTLAAGTMLDLGGIAKGWTSDRIVEAGVATVVSAGGDIRSSDPTLVVEILDGDDAVAAEVAVGVGALATSSRMRRRWRTGAIRAHHIIDPRTGSPAVTPVLSASVIAETAVEAEAGAKAVLILGADGLAWADEQDWIRAAVAIWYDGNVYATSEVRAA